MALHGTWRWAWAGGVVVAVLAGIAAGQTRPGSAPAGAMVSIPAEKWDAVVEREVQARLPAAVDAEISRRLAQGDEKTLRANEEMRYRIYREVQASVEQRTRVSEAYNMVRIARSQLELYSVQHRGAVLTLAELKNWKPLLGTSDEKGRLSAKGVFGPYLSAAPVNPLTRRSAVVAAGEANCMAGWSYDEKAGKLRLILPREAVGVEVAGAAGGIFAVDQIETPTAAADRAAIKAAGALMAVPSMLQTMRSQLELYKIQHGDTKPTLAELRDWHVLLVATDENGKDVARGGMGPYMQGAPVNPLNGKSRVSAARKADAETGWTYDREKWELRAVVSEAQREELAEGDVEVAGDAR